MARIANITGKIELVDGTVSEFVIDQDGVWTQWGAERARLGLTVDALDAMVQGLIYETDLISATEDEDDEQ